jgi:hypothetical protein
MVEPIRPQRLVTRQLFIEDSPNATEQASRQYRVLGRYAARFYEQRDGPFGRLY